MRAVLITGPPGAGKTAVLTALMDVLEADGVRHAAVEVEALGLGRPWPDHETVVSHVEFVARSFERRGYPLLLVSATIEDAAYLRRLRAALPSDDLFLVRLEAPPELLRERIARREPPDWVGLPRLLDATGPLARSHAELPGVDLVVSTVDAEPSQVATAIRQML